MSLVMGEIVQQSGVIPWRLVDGRLQIMLVTNTRHDRWVIPKGHLEPLMTAHDSAAIEAFEEAGVRGKPGASPIGAWHYRKRGTRFEVQVYPMEVSEVLEAWPEATRRRRKWLAIGKAAQRVHNSELAALIRMLPKILLHPKVP